MSYLESLLKKRTPLELHERAALQDWLGVLEEDCAMFGPTQEDKTRMAAIKAKLNEKGATR